MREGKRTLISRRLWWGDQRPEGRAIQDPPIDAVGVHAVQPPKVGATSVCPMKELARLEEILGIIVCESRRNLLRLLVPL